MLLRLQPIIIRGRGIITRHLRIIIPDTPTVLGFPVTGKEGGVLMAGKECGFLGTGNIMATKPVK